MNGYVLVVLLAVAAGIYGARETVAGVKKVSVASYHHVLRPIGCGTKKVVTLGQKHCAVQVKK